MRGATPKPGYYKLDDIDFNPRAPCGARRSSGSGAPGRRKISIHAPHAGRDLSNSAVACSKTSISIHAPHAGRDSSARPRVRYRFQFQSTRPMRGATKAPQHRYLFLTKFQSTRPMRGATGHRATPLAATVNFNPRAPCGARRRRSPRTWGNPEISIHAPHAGRDQKQAGQGTEQADFNPRAPCGARQQKYTKLLYTLLRQKAILRQFHAKRRLLKHFSTYKYRNTFLICSANRMGKICTLLLRTTRSLDLPEGMSACNQSARFCFRTFFPSSKTADYPAPDP